MKRIAISAFIMLNFVLNTYTVMSQSEIHGFRLIEKRFVKEVNSECLYFEHVKSGARLFKIASDDDNKTFCISFKTLPESDNGVAHIMEHSVLNGSKKFPVKSPFDILSKGSLNTFMNAFTSRDATSYPFASKNDKDYFNMMEVYLDAVYNPLIYTDTRILRQEGWHYELASKDEPVIYKGVVYNEMKGAFSNPHREHLYYILKSLFPDNVYGYESGGIPSAITHLTQEEFTGFHKKYYHPSNSYIFLYGNADINKELEFIDREYLSHYKRSSEKVEIPAQKAFSKVNYIHEYYPVVEGDNTENQTYLSMNFVIGRNNDYTNIAALKLLAEVLVNQESAPLRLALQKAGIGQDVSSYVLEFMQSGISIIIKNANASDKEKCREVIMNTLNEVVKNGINKNDLKGVINRYEFSVREGSNAQKGVEYQNMILPGWFFGDSPYTGLEYEKHLETLKKGADGRYFEDLIKKGMIENNHCSFITLEPKPGLDKERNIKVEKELAEYKASLTEAEKEKLIIETKNLIAFQNKEDSPENIATIPMLSLSDINKENEFYSCKEINNEKLKILHFEEFTDGIVYANLMFDMRSLPKELIPYAALLSNIAVMMNTGKYDYALLNQELNLHTGDFSTSVFSFSENNNPDKILPYFSVSGKVMAGNSEKMFELALEILRNLKYSDSERLKELISRHQAQLESSFNRDGFQVALRRLQSYFSVNGMFNELTQGLDYFRFVTDLSVNFDNRSSEISDNLKKAALNMFTSNNLTTTVTCSKEDISLFSNDLNKFASLLPAGSGNTVAWNFIPENHKEAILSSSKVQYVTTGYNIRQMGQVWDGKLLVLNQILSTDFLYNQIRVIGGAYGGMSRISSDGTLIFGSYRDPNLKNTLDVYEKAGDYVSTFDADETTMTRYIIGTIAEMDGAKTVQQRGSIAFKNYFTGKTTEDQQKERNQVLSTKASDIRNYAEMIKEMTGRKVICVYGNTDIIQTEKSLFNKIIKIRNDG